MLLGTTWALRWIHAGLPCSSSFLGKAQHGAFPAAGSKPTSAIRLSVRPSTHPSIPQAHGAVPKGTAPREGTPGGEPRATTWPEDHVPCSHQRPAFRGSSYKAGTDPVPSLPSSLGNGEI